MAARHPSPAARPRAQGRTRPRWHQRRMGRAALHVGLGGHSGDRGELSHSEGVGRAHLRRQVELCALGHRPDVVEVSRALGVAVLLLACCSSREPEAHQLAGVMHCAAADGHDGVGAGGRGSITGTEQALLSAAHANGGAQRCSEQALLFQGGHQWPCAAGTRAVGYHKDARAGEPLQLCERRAGVVFSNVHCVHAGWNWARRYRRHVAAAGCSCRRRATPPGCSASTAPRVQFSHFRHKELPCYSLTNYRTGSVPRV